MVHLDRVAEWLPEPVEGQADDRVGLAGLVAVLDRQAHDSHVGRLLGRAVDRAIAWDSRDQRDREWWPQGITSTSDASEDGEIDGRRLLVTSWYSKVGAGVRLSVLDLETLRYRHVRLVRLVAEESGGVRTEPVKVHAGGIVWAGDHLHVAATARGFVTARMSDVVSRDGELLLPVRWRYRAHAEDAASRLRYSFLSLDRSVDPPVLLAGEYGRGAQSTRLARFPLDPATWLPQLDDEGLARPHELADGGLVQMQGAVLAGGRHHVLASRGPWLPGTAYVGGPGRWRRFRWAAPMGPEDLTYVPQTGRLWSLTEHPRRRWVISMRASWFDED